ncbi:MAG: hypothetical protein ACI4QR_03330, partial [Eubacteriales bacterium]
MQNNKTKKIFSFLLAAVFLLLTLVFPISCTGKRIGGIKVGVLRKDDVSGEATAWEEYLSYIGGEFDIKFDFTTTDSSPSEISAIKRYSAKGYDAIFLLSDDGIVPAVNAAAKEKMYIVCPVGHPSSEEYREIFKNNYYLGSVAPSEETEYEAGYDMAKYFAEEKGKTSFTVFGGAAGLGASIHIQRLAGIITYLCEDGGDYDSKRKCEDIAAKISSEGFDIGKFHSEKYKITGYIDGFEFDEAFDASLTKSLEDGGECILCVGGGDSITRLANSIVSSHETSLTFISGGIDAIAKDYLPCFETGYSFDRGKYASAMAPAVILLLSALNGSKLQNA